MVERTESKQEQAIRYIRMVLWAVWDLIGVFGEPRAEDEYDGYALVVYSMLRRNVFTQQITDYLTEMQTNNMGVKISEKYHVPIRYVVDKLQSLLERDCFDPLD